MPTRRRPMVAITLDPRTIDYVNEYARAHGGLPFSRAVEALIEDRAAAYPQVAGGENDQDNDRDTRTGRRAPRRWT